MFNEIFKKKKLIPERLISYGFEKKEAAYQYFTAIQDGEFSLAIQINADGTVDTNLIENETGEPYVLYKTNASGAYIGEIRTEIGQILADIAEHCYETEIFKTKQAQMVIEYVRERYGDELEFLWKKFPDNAVWRRKDNKKWYGAILTVVGKKIGLETDKLVEIIDLRMDSAKSESILSRKHYYPGWHMNKKSWYTLVLDGSIPNEELKVRIAESYGLAAK